MKITINLKKRPVARRKNIEVIELSDKGEIQVWCKVAVDLGLMKCPGKCEECFCG